MKVSVATFLLVLFAAITSLGHPQPNSLARDARVADSPELPDLEKRRGGGRGGGGGGRSGGGGGGRSGSSRPPSTHASSNAGGRSSQGSGPQPAYGRGGNAYAGGAAVPYTAGKSSPRGLVPFLLPAAALAFFPGIWLYGIYAYPYDRPYHYMNQTSNRNESIPVVCVCQEYSVCGCDKNHDNGYFKDLFGGPVPTNTSKVQVAEVDDTEKVYINGTLPNGTTLADPDASAAAPTLLQSSGYWVPAAIVASAVWLL